MLIMPNRKLYVLITYIDLGPQALWAPGGRTACPPPLGRPWLLRASLGKGAAAGAAACVGIRTESRLDIRVASEL